MEKQRTADCQGGSKTKARDEIICDEHKERGDVLDLFNATPFAMVLIDSEGVLRDANQTWLDLAGCDRKETVIGKTSAEMGLFGDAESRERILEDFHTHGSVRHRETTFHSKNGANLHVLVNMNWVRTEGGHFILLSMQDLSEHKRTEELQGRLAAIVSSADDAIIGKDLKGIIRTWNVGAEKLFGYKAEEVIGKNISLLLPPGHKDEVSGILERLSEGEQIGNFESLRMRKDGTVFPAFLTYSAIKDANGKVVGASKFVHDITERKKVEEEREATVEFLHLINKSRKTRELIRGALLFFQKHSDCEAIGIRLQEGDDYPYYETRGFPERFVLADMHLCTRDGKGGFLRDGAGRPELTCMCGNVIRGRFDPAKPFFTTKGSFWSNCTTDLLDSTSESERQARILNRCSGEGYESVALIPLKLGVERFGLLQLNDRRRDRFTLQSITLWERFADYLAVALAKFRAEEALHRAKAEWERTFDSVPDLIAILDNRHRVLQVNKAMARRLGVGAEKCVGLHCHEIVHGTSCPPGFCPHSRTIDDGGEHCEEVHQENLGGDFLITTTPLLDERGQSIGSVHIAHDITERKQAEEALKKLNEELEARVAKRTEELRFSMENLEKEIENRKRTEIQLQQTLREVERSNKELEQFAYVASHDLQEPLRMVSSYTQLLGQRYEGQLDDKAKKFINYAVDGAVRMQRLINDLLAYSRVNSQGKAPEMVDSQAVLSETLRALAPVITENQAIVISDALPVVRADALQLSQLFQNLIANAIKFRRADIPRIHVATDDLGSEWRFSFKDNGIGIERQYADKVFVIFQRLHTRMEYPGTGIGLAVCKRIVERHGGRIWFESVPGEGTTFLFTLQK